jgi:hypothetical protein
MLGLTAKQLRHGSGCTVGSQELGTQGLVSPKMVVSRRRLGPGDVEQRTLVVRNEGRQVPGKLTLNPNFSSQIL